MKKYLNINEKAYDHLCNEYEKRRQKYKNVSKRIAAPFVKHLEKNFKKIGVLELGPGSGIDLSLFEKEGFETTAIDISKKMIELSKKIAPNTKYIHDDFLSHDFGRKKFEGIFARVFIHLFPKKDAILSLKKIKKLLVPKGVLFLTTTLHSESKEGYSGKEDYPTKLKRFRKRWTEKELINTVKRT